MVAILQTHRIKGSPITDHTGLPILINLDGHKYPALAIMRLTDAGVSYRDVVKKMLSDKLKFSLEFWLFDLTNDKMYRLSKYAQADSKLAHDMPFEGIVIRFIQFSCF